MSFNFDRSRLTADLADIVQDAARSVLEGAVTDLRDYAARIAFDTTQALLLPPPERNHALEEIYAQLRIIGELQRLRAQDAAWEAFNNTITLVAKTAVSALIAAI